jgi:hypothetical protein
MEIVANVNCYETVNSRVQTGRKVFYLNSDVLESILQLHKLATKEKAQHVRSCILPTPVYVTCMRKSITKTAFIRKRL